MKGNFRTLTPQKLTSKPGDQQLDSASAGPHSDRKGGGHSSWIEVVGTGLEVVDGLGAGLEILGGGEGFTCPLAGVAGFDGAGPSRHTFAQPLLQHNPRPGQSISYAGRVTTIQDNNFSPQNLATNS